MDFLRECATALDSGVSAAEILARMRLRYTTVRSINVHTCLVRQLCAPSPAYVAAKNALLESEEDEETRARLAAALANGGKTADADIRERLATLPHRLCDNVYALRVTRDEMYECKRLATRGAMKKNCTRRSVDGRALLSEARALVAHPEAAPPGVLDLSMALMIVTGRRTCESLNGRSTFASARGEEGEEGEEETPPVAEYAARFGGQAKRRASGGEDDVYEIPLLAPLAQVARAVRELRRRQRGRDKEEVELTNRAASRRYQSELRKRLQAKGGAWDAVGCVHDLRGIYACMCLRLFKWPPEYSEAYVAMSILGHRGLHESLVYTPFFLGDDFGAEKALGVGCKLRPPPLDAEA
jgi:hypothetical protein